MREEMATDTHIPFCTIVAMDDSNLCYRACCKCESSVPESGKRTSCTSCGNAILGHGSKMLYRLQLSIATEERVLPVVAFDRATQRLMGCSADEFFQFASTNPFAAQMVGKALKGEMVEIVLRAPRSGRAQHMRVASITPLDPTFQPLMTVLKHADPRHA